MQNDRTLSDHKERSHFYFRYQGNLQKYNSIKLGLSRREDSWILVLQSDKNPEKRYKLEGKNSKGRAWLGTTAHTYSGRLRLRITSSSPI